MHQRVSAVRVVSSMWLAEDVVARRVHGPHDICRENSAIKVCTVWGGGEGQGGEHLLFECTAVGAVELKEVVGAAVGEEVGRLVKPGPVRDK